MPSPFRTGPVRVVFLLAAGLLVPWTGLAAQERPTGIAAREAAAAEEDPFDFYDRGPYRDDVPRPVDFLGYRLGSLHTPHRRIVAYFRALAEAAPDRIRIERYGTSYEGRPLILAFLGSEEVLERRGDVRSAVGRLASPRGVSPEAAAGIAAETPVVVWLDYGNDGNETANSEAAMQVAYQLVAGEGEGTGRLREEALVILNPGHNPESRDRFVAWYNAFGIGAEDPSAFEHDAPWGMGTSNNHYQVDLNRDGWGLTQRETQAVAAEILDWKPQVFVDHHGETQQYYFPPPTLPVNPELPASHRRWYETFGRGNARAFDRQGWQYYVRDVFDLHYPGYFDSWPALHGAIGMTYETDGGGNLGLRWRRNDGSVVTYRDGIAHHYVASLATVRTAAENREPLLRDFAEFFRSAVERGAEGEPARAYVLLPGDDPRRAAVLASTMLRHGVEVRRSSAGFRARGRHHQSGETVVREFPAGSYVVDMAQPQGRAAATFLRADTPLDSAFVREQIAIWQRNARRGENAPMEGQEFYDLTAWSLPLAFGVDAYALQELPDVEGQPVRPATGRLAGHGGWTQELAFDPAGLEEGVTEVIPDVPPLEASLGPDAASAEPASAAEGGEAAGGADAARRAAPADSAARARSAYLFEGGTEGSLRLLAALLRRDYRVAVADRPLMAGDRTFPRGTYVLRVGRNPASLHEDVRRLARSASVGVVASHTAFPSRGPRGPGSSDLRAVHPPRVAVAAGEGVDTRGYGHTWFTLERRLDYPFTPLALESVARGALEPYDVLVLPDGSSGAIRDELGERGRERLEAWLQRGGVLVGWGGASVFAVDAELVAASLVAREAAGEGATDTLRAEERLAQIDALPARPEPVPAAVSPTARPGALKDVPGAILRAELDRTHWLTLGYRQDGLPVPAMDDEFLTLSPSGSNPVVFPAEGDFRLAGFTWPGNTERLLAGTAWSVVERAGQGGVVLFGADPNFRLVWRSTTQLFANAVLLGPSLGASGGAGY